jgi:putative ABC transport system permease protein
MLRALDRKLLRDLWRIKGQAIAIAAVIGSGVAMFVMYRSTFDSLGQTLDSYYDRHRFAHVFASAKRAPEGLAARIALIPGVARAETRVIAGVTLDLPDMDEPAAGHLVSIPADRRPALNDLFLRKGRWIAPGRPDEILLSESFAERHALEPGSSLVALINGRRRELRVVGIALSPEFVYSIRPGDLMPDPERFGVLWMERRALAAAFDLEGSFNDVVIRLGPGASEKEVLARLDRLLAPYGSLGGVGRDQQTSHWFISNELTQLMNMGQLLPTLFMAVAAFLLNVVLTRIVSVQREQIAALKANGYSNLDLGIHFGKLGGIIALGGAAIGTAMGAWMGLGVTALYTDMFRFPVLAYHLAPYRIGQAALVAVVASVLGALGAVRRVASLPPAEAMRPEAPAVYGRTTLERIGLGRFLSAPSRMILRNLSKRPLRTAVGVLGIAVGGALIVLGTSMREGVWALLDEQFEVLQRQDATVTFTEPASARAFHELRRLPGVVYAEPMRSVAVRLRNGHLWRRTAIQGMLGESRLERLVDVETLEPIPLPADGLILSTTLAEILGVEPGDVLTVEVLEGARRVAQVPVIRLVEQHMGISAYMRIDAVQRLAGQGRSLTAVALQVEPSRSDELYSRLKQMPRVAAVSRKSAFIESFHSNFAKNLDVLVNFTMLFAVIIAFGVVYNNARISLSERTRELASLRVLGFRRAEISYIFLGELAVVTLLSLPPLFVLGYGLASYALTSFDSELYRFPLILSRQSFAMAGLTVVLASLVSGLAVRRKLDKLDLIAVLKTRE